MTLDAGITLGVVGFCLVALAREWMEPDLLLLAALGFLIAVGVVELEEALSGFADPTLLAIGALFVVAAGLRATGALRKASDLLFGGFTSLRSVLVRLTTASAVSSAFLNNTPIVAMGIPSVLAWTRGRDIAPSRLLIPLSYASILGGVCTLIGTSTNLVADGLLREQGEAGLGFFELGAVGAPLALVGLAYLVLVAPRLLPERADLGEEGGGEGTLGADIHLYRVPEGSLAVGRTVKETGLSTPELTLARLVRESGEVRRVAPETVVDAGDRLTFRGESSSMASTAGRLGLEPVVLEDQPDLEGGVELTEAVVPEGSVLAGEEVAEVDFRDRYGALVLGVIRDGRQLDEIQDVTLRPGDALLLVVREGMARAYADTKDFYLTGGHATEEEAAMEVSLWRPTRAKAGVVILAAVVILATTGILHISLAALGGAVAMTTLGFVTPAEARRSVDWSVLLVIGSAVGLGHALTASGAADLIARGVVEVGAPMGARGILAALVAGSMLLTLVITNNAAVAILFPVAVSVAGSQGIDPRPLVVGVTVSASLAFATPLGYQTNLMVYGPGGYRFSDYMKAGLPLQLLLGAVAVVLIPFIWGF